MTYCEQCEKAFQDNRNVCTEVDNEFHVTVDESEMFIDEYPGIDDDDLPGVTVKSLFNPGE